MWVYLEIEPGSTDFRVDFVKGKKGRRNPVYYDATCRLISESCPKAEGLVVPDFLAGCVYDVILFILQVRLEATSGLQTLPIRLKFHDDDRYLGFCDRFGMTELGLNNIGVVLVSPDQNVADISAIKPQSAAVEKYLSKEAGRPKFKEGRHDQANRWGPYIFLRVLEQIDASLATRREAVERRMFEEPYLKRLAKTLEDDVLPQKILDSLRSEQSWLRERLCGQTSVRKVFVVEDRLDEGWRDVYEVVFGASDSRVSMIWAKTADEALAKFSKEIALVVLDVRLEPKDEAVDSHDGSVPTGVKLARQLRKKSSATPVIAATASNKTWVFEPLVKYGIQGYWVKESPEQTGNLLHAARNVRDFYQKTREILEWSDRTRPWIEDLSLIVQQVQETDLHHGRILEEKAKSLHALLDRAFSPFSRELDSGLQLNVAFLILFSCMNDLRAWCCDVVERDDDEKEWLLVEGLGGELLVRQHRVDHQRPASSIVYEIDNTTTEQFPDTKASISLLNKIGLYGQTKTFRRLKDNIRNALPLTHGLSDAETRRGIKASNASDKDLSDMLEVLKAVVAKRRERRTDASS